MAYLRVESIEITRPIDPISPAPRIALGQERRDGPGQPRSLPGQGRLALVLHPEVLDVTPQLRRAGLPDDAGHERRVEREVLQAAPAPDLRFRGVAEAVRVPGRPLERLRRRRTLH